uniref:Uncharacterized protein n=1 Tax=Arundo donax TaxID=35708 RepID=A0A0A9DJG1_ARUDO
MRIQREEDEVIDCFLFPLPPNTSRTSAYIELQGWF